MNIQYSIIIPSFNEGKQLRQTVKNISKTAGLNNFEIIVVDDGSTDHSSDFLKKPQESIHLITTRHSGASKARNEGAKKAVGKILVFIDAHVRFDHGWLKQINNLLHKKKSIKILTGSIINSPSVKKNREHFYLYTNIDVSMSQSFFLRVKKKADLLKVPYAGSGCLIIYKNVFNDIGGFSTFFSWGIEDRFLSMVAYRLGYDIYLDTGLNIYHNLKWSFRDIEAKHKKNRLKNSLFACYLLYPSKDFKDCLTYLNFTYPQLEKRADYLFFLKNKAQLTKVKRNLNKASLRTYDDFVKEYYLFLPYLQISDYRKACQLINKSPKKAYQLLLQASKLTYTNNLEETAKIMVDIKQKLQKLKKKYFSKQP